MKLSKGKINTNSELLLSTSTEEKIEMKIDENAMAFVISRLTDLYTDPIVATVREVISNAIDATINVDKDLRKPIIVNLPTEFSENFVVTDLGSGMSRETIKTIYSQYGASTKRDDMSQIGAYGLGAKAPLSYCSQFVVESTKDGMTTELSVSNEKTGNHTRIISCEYTGAPNGTKVTIPARRQDFYHFVNAAKTYANYAFNVEIKFIGANFTKEELTKLGSINMGDKTQPLFTDVYIHTELSKDTDYLKAKALLRLGILDSDDISVDSVLSGFIYRDNENYGRQKVIVDLKPGMVDFASSRDTITKNARYSNYINNVCSGLKEYSTKRIEEELNSGGILLTSLLRATTELLSQYGVKDKIYNLIKEILIKEEKTNLFDFIYRDNTADEEIFTSIISFNKKDLYVHGKDNGNVISTYGSISKLKEKKLTPESLSARDLISIQNKKIVVIHNFNPDNFSSSRNKIWSRFTAFRKKYSEDISFNLIFSKQDKETTEKYLSKVINNEIITYFTEEEWFKSNKPVITKVKDSKVESLIKTRGHRLFDSQFISNRYLSNGVDYLSLTDVEGDDAHSTLFISNDLNSISESTLIRACEMNPIDGTRRVVVMLTSALTKKNIDRVLNAFDAFYRFGELTSSIKYVSEALDKTKIKEFKIDNEKKVEVNLSNNGIEMFISSLTSDLNFLTHYDYFSSQLSDNALTLLKNFDSYNSYSIRNSFILDKLTKSPELIEFLSDGSEKQEINKKLIELFVQVHPISYTLRSITWSYRDSFEKDNETKGLLSFFANDLIKKINEIIG